MENINYSGRTTQRIIEDIDTVWGEVQPYIFLQKENNSPVNFTAKEKFVSKLKHFNERHSSANEYIIYVASSLSRGHALIKAALEWEDPCAGKASENSNSHSKARGLQWRLVMAYSGFEIIVKTLMIHKGSGCQHEFLDKFITLCEQADNSCYLERQNTSKVSIRKWIEDEEKLFQFLKVKYEIQEDGDYKLGEDAKSIKNWIDNSEKETLYINSAESVKLAKALRNCTAHGSLSANKVKEWKIENLIDYLTRQIAEIAIAALRKLN